MEITEWRERKKYAHVHFPLLGVFENPNPLLSPVGSKLSTIQRAPTCHLKRVRPLERVDIIGQPVGLRIAVDPADALHGDGHVLGGGWLTVRAERAADLIRAKTARKSRVVCASV